MRVVTTRDELRALRAGCEGPVGVVMTMGALHQGHASLLEAARAGSRTVVATVFVNQTQFGPNEDFDRYPRTLESDLDLCRDRGVDVVFAPPAGQMYPNGAPRVSVDPGPLGAILEGAYRPGFFRGVLTIVMKLLNLVHADMAFFGEKDYQQLVMIEEMVQDLNWPVEVVGVPTVREADGLALSSRNRYLSEAERHVARTLSAALAAGVSAAGRVGATARSVGEAAAAVLAAEPRVTTDYLAVADRRMRAVHLAVDASGGGSYPDPGPDEGGGPTVENAWVEPVGPGARILVAARVGGTRLIDNMAVGNL